MSTDTILKDIDGKLYSYDNVKGQGWLEGKASGVERVVNFLLTRSGQCFIAGNDRDARLLRGMSEEIERTLLRSMTAEAEDNKKSHPEVIK